MLRLLSPNIGPVGGIRFIDPDTGFEYSKAYKDFEELEVHVHNYRDQNKLEPLEDFRKIWEHWICNQVGMEKRCCPVATNIARTFEQYVAGAKAFLRRAVSTEKFVASGISESRASVCVDCNQNLGNTGHRMSQFYSDRFMRHQVGNLKTSLDDKLFTCKVCTCLLRSKVHYPDKEVADSLSDTEVGRLNREPKSLTSGRKLKCWQLQAVENSK